MEGVELFLPLLAEARDEPLGKVTYAGYLSN